MKTIPLLVVVAVAMIAACMPSRPPQELVDARAAYARAYVGPAAEANVAGLHEARRALDDAEAKYAEDPTSEEARHLAYLAHRRVLLAETNARAVIATEQRLRAERALALAQGQAHQRGRTHGAAKAHERQPTDDRDKARTATSP